MTYTFGNEDFSFYILYYQKNEKPFSHYLLHESETKGVIKV